MQDPGTGPSAARPSGLPTSASLDTHAKSRAASATRARGAAAPTVPPRGYGGGARQVRPSILSPGTPTEIAVVPVSRTIQIVSVSS